MSISVRSRLVASEDLAAGALHRLDAELLGVLARDDRYRERTVAEYVIGLPLFAS
jgi:hypothetical protein